MLNEQVQFSISELPIRVSRSAVEHYTAEHNIYEGRLCPVHYHDQIEFLLILSGMLRCDSDDNQYILNEGDVLFINSRIPHTTTVLEDKTRYILLQFDISSSGKGAFRYVSRFLKTNSLPCYQFRKSTSENKQIYDCIINIYEENQNRNNAYEFYMGANMYMIIALLHRMNILFDENQIKDKKAIDKIMPVLEYVDKNYSDQLTLEGLSDLLNFNKSYFCRLFKRATNSTFTEYLNFVRICKAEKMLKNGLGVSETAYAVGFSSLSYFNRTFKKYMLCSPSSYKKIMSQRKDYDYDFSQK